jgi:hypothetical protein
LNPVLDAERVAPEGTFTSNHHTEKPFQPPALAEKKEVLLQVASSNVHVGEKSGNTNEDLKQSEKSRDFNLGEMKADAFFRPGQYVLAVRKKPFQAPRKWIQVWQSFELEFVSVYSGDLPMLA